MPRASSRRNCWRSSCRPTATSDLYFLGPKAFMRAVYQNGLALGVAPERMRCEFFGPKEELLAA